MIGPTISHYRITGKLGIGGMGVVYERHALRLARPVALKILPMELAGDPEATRHLQRERRR
jgi:serine/threonine protein kinase